MNKEYIAALQAELLFPQDAQSYILECAEKIERVCDSQMEEALWAFEKQNNSFDGFDARFERIEELCGVHKDTVAAIFLLLACQRLEKAYEAAGYKRELFIETMSDLRYKLIECKQTHGVYGNFVYKWEKGFFDMTRFALGRFQFERIPFAGVCYGAQGIFIRKGETVLNMHIPSSGVPLTDEVRLDSYQKARAFFFPEATGAVPFVCNSWLLYPEYEDIIPDKMNLKRFRHDFSLFSMEESEKFNNAWRVFGDKAELEADQLPRDTSMRRMFADYVKSGKKHGNGYGVFFFDGEKIIK